MSPHDDNDKELTCLLFALWFPQHKSGTPLTPVPMDLTLRVMGDKISESHAQARGAETGKGRRRKAGEEQSRQRQASSEDEKIKDTLFAVGTHPRTRKQPLGPQRADSN